MNTAESAPEFVVSRSRSQLRGTPSLVLVDRAGRIRLNAFGRLEDLAVGAAVARLIDEPAPTTGGCDPDLGCAAPTREQTP